MTSLHAPGSAELLTDHQMAEWNRDGYLIIDRFVDEDTVERLRSAYDEFLAGTYTTEYDGQLGDRIRQVLRPCDVHPVFDDNPALSRAMAYARRLMGGSAVRRSYDMLIYKEPGHPNETPWHQDAAYDKMPLAEAGSPVRGHSIQFWIALDPVDEDNGCMRFVGGRHREPLMEHYVVSDDPDDPQRLLALTQPDQQLDLGAAVSAVLPAGGATVHMLGTPHYTGPNRTTDRGRRAYIFNLVLDT